MTTLIQDITPILLLGVLMGLMVVGIRLTADMTSRR